MEKEENPVVEKSQVLYLSRILPGRSANLSALYPQEGVQGDGVDGLEVLSRLTVLFGGGAGF